LDAVGAADDRRHCDLPSRHRLTRSTKSARRDRSHVHLCSIFLLLSYQTKNGDIKSLLYKAQKQTNQRKTIKEFYL
jgi:hypothetical protein